MRGLGMFTSQSTRYTCVHTCTHSVSGYTRQADKHRLGGAFCDLKSHGSSDRVSFMAPGLRNLCIEKHLSAVRSPGLHKVQTQRSVTGFLTERDL